MRCARFFDWLDRAPLYWQIPFTILALIVFFFGAPIAAVTIAPILDRICK
jgi:hypothetical protein